MGTRIFTGSTRKFKKTWQKIFRWNGVRRGEELSAKCDYVIVNRNGWVAWRCLLFQGGTKESGRLSWQEQGHKARRSLHRNRKGMKRELAKATHSCVLPGWSQQVKQAPCSSSSECITLIFKASSCLFIYSLIVKSEHSSKVPKNLIALFSSYTQQQKYSSHV